MSTYLASTLFIILAEMGDKTQLLAMAFATQFNWKIVMAGVLVATLFNHLIAVIIGAELSQFIPMFYVHICTALSFVIFGLWTIRGDSLDNANESRIFNPFWTVAIAFFLAEMGDKTQFTTIALAAKYDCILPVWLGTTTGMMVADALGVFFGMTICKKLSTTTIKWFSAVVFMLFGYYGIYESLSASTWRYPAILLTIILSLITAWRLTTKNKSVSVK